MQAILRLVLIHSPRLEAMQNQTESFADKCKQEYERGKRILDKYSVPRSNESYWPIVVLVTAILSLCSGYLIGFVVGSLHH